MPEQQTFTAQQKLNALYIAGVSPALMPGGGLGLGDSFSRGLCSCCGVIDMTRALTAYVTKEKAIENYKRKIYDTRTGVDQDIATPILSCAVVIPDATGNILLEWEDK